MRQCICLLVLTGLSVLIGCGRQAGVEGVIKVTGTVTYQGKPVDGASVTFSPDSATGRAASGRTDASGRFELTTLNAGDGVLAGSYKVAISKIEDLDPAHHITAEEMAKLAEQGKSVPIASMKTGQKGGGLKHHVPEKYEKADSSGLTATVKAGGDNKFEFTLE